jgi:hypothetical protein
MVYLILAFVSSGVCDGWGCSSAGRAPALQAGGQRFDPAQLHQFTLVSRRADIISFEEKTSLHHFDEVLPVLQKS